jgi:hypothetical protein
MTSQAKSTTYKRASNRWAALHARIEAHASLLVDQGDLVLKAKGANRYWHLRFLLPADEQGHRRHRSLYVGRERDQELVARVQALVESYREPRRQIQEIARYVSVIRTLNRGVRATARRLGA